MLIYLLIYFLFDWSGSGTYQSESAEFIIQNSKTFYDFRFNSPLHSLPRALSNSAKFRLPTPPPPQLTTIYTKYAKIKQTSEFTRVNQCPNLLISKNGSKTNRKEKIRTYTARASKSHTRSVYEQLKKKTACTVRWIMNEYGAKIFYFWKIGQQQVFARRSGLNCWQTISKEKKNTQDYTNIM